MDPLVLQSFGGELIKTSISAKLVLRAIKGRVAQGARVAPKMMQQAESAAAKGLTSTPVAMRRTALGAAESGRAAQGAKTLAQRSGVAPQRAALQARGAQMTEALKKAPETVTAPFAAGSARLGTTRGYAPAAAEFMAGKGTMVQARAATFASPSVLTPQGALPASGIGQAARREAMIPQGSTRIIRGAKGTARPVTGIQATQIAKRPLMPQTGRTLSGPAMAYQKTMLQPRAAVGLR